MAQRTVVRYVAPCPLFFATLHSWAMPEIVEDEAVPASAGGIGYGPTEGCGETGTACVGAGDFAEDLAVLVLELRGGEAAQALNLFSDP